MENRVLVAALAVSASVAMGACGRDGDAPLDGAGGAGQGGATLGGAGGVAASGSSGTGGSGTGQGGTAGEAGAGGEAGAVSGAPGSSGASTGGTSGTDGQGGDGGEATAGGTAGAPDAASCAYDASPLATTASPAPSEEVWERLGAFLYGEAPAPPNDLPASADADWAREAALGILQQASDSDERLPGLEKFFEGWDLDADAQERWVAVLRDDGFFGDLFESMTSDGPGRSGILTETSMLTASTRISERGTWMLEHLFCATVPAPPPDLDFDLEPPSDFVGTRREWLAQQTAEPACAGCHRLLDPPGLSLENFDDLGEFRTTDNGSPIDASGDITMLDETFTFSDVVELGEQAAASCGVARCFAQQLFEHALALSQPELDPPGFDAEALDRVAQRFSDSGFSFHALIGAIVSEPAFLK